MKMPKDLSYISAQYEVYSVFDVEDVEWQKVDDYNIKYNELHLEYKDGTSETLHPMQDSFDTKWAKKETFYNNYHRVTE